MGAFIRTADRISRGAAVLAALVLVYMVAHIMLEIVLRAFFATSTFVADEFVGYGVATATFLALGQTLRDGGMIRVTLLVERLSPRGRAIGLLLSVLVALAVVGLLAGYLWRGLARDYLRGTVSSSIAEVPLWIPAALALAGIAVFLLQLLAEAARALRSPSEG